MTTPTQDLLYTQPKELSLSRLVETETLEVGKEKLSAHGDEECPVIPSKVLPLPWMLLALEVDVI